MIGRAFLMAGERFSCLDVSESDMSRIQYPEPIQFKMVELLPERSANGDGVRLALWATERSPMCITVPLLDRHGNPCANVLFGRTGVTRSFRGETLHLFEMLKTLKPEEEPGVACRFATCLAVSPRDFDSN